MVHHQDSGPEYDFEIFQGRRYVLTLHVRRRMEQRGISRDWITIALDNWVARNFNEKNDSTNYYGFIPGQEHLLLVALSETNLTIPTVFHDGDATEAFNQGDWSYFDEVR